MSTTGATLELVSPEYVLTPHASTCQPSGCSPNGGPQCHPDDIACRPYPHNEACQLDGYDSVGEPCVPR